VSFSTNQIFEGTFRDNILIGRIIDDKELSSIIRLLKLDEYIIHQPQGIDSIVDSGGRRLPRSIIQKLLIARIIIGVPKLLLMEDPLQFIAEEEKIRIIDYIMDDRRNWTAIVVSDFYYWKEKCTSFIALSKN
jgi:ABC-type multidrug transport system fused ATPase/permease subunit